MAPTRRKGPAKRKKSVRQWPYGGKSAISHSIHSTDTTELPSAEQIPNEHSKSNGKEEGPSESVSQKEGSMGADAPTSATYPARRRVMVRRVRAVVKHKPRGSKADTSALSGKAERVFEAVPPKLEEVIRRPYHLRKASSMRKNRRKSKALVSLFAQRLKTSTAWLGKLIRPHAILLWLQRAEPYSAEYLLEHAEYLGYSAGEDDADPVISSELDSIINRFQESSLDKSLPTYENPALEIPKDFSMQLTTEVSEGHADFLTRYIDRDTSIARLRSGRRPSIAPSETDDEDEEMLDGLGKQIRAGPSQTVTLEPIIEDEPEDVIMVAPVKPVVKQISKHGFDPVQVLKKHAVGFEDGGAHVQVNNLSTPIHTIFRPENFHGCPERVYETLQPGLRLATLLLTHRATAHFWHTLCFGELSSTAHPGVKRIAKDVSWSKRDDQAYATRLAGLSEYIHFHFALFASPQQPDLHTYGTAHPMKDLLVGWAPKPGDPCRRVRIRLHTDFYTTARRLSKLRNPDPAQVLRFHLFFAVNIVHELAHFLWRSSWQFEMEDVYAEDMTVLHTKHPQEPYMNDQAFNELGEAFETKVFGGRVHPISCRIDCAYGLTTFDQPGLVDALKIRTYYTIPMTYISRLQQQKTWDELVDGGSKDVFHIPRDGAMSISVPFFDMTVWRDEEVDEISDVHEKKQTPFVRIQTGIVRATSPGKEE